MGNLRHALPMERALPPFTSSLITSLYRSINLLHQAPRSMLHIGRSGRKDPIRSTSTPKGVSGRSRRLLHFRPDESQRCIVAQMVRTNHRPKKNSHLSQFNSGLNLLGGESVPIFCSEIFAQHAPRSDSKSVTGSITEVASVV